LTGEDKGEGEGPLTLTLSRKGREDKGRQLSPAEERVPGFLSLDGRGQVRVTIGEIKQQVPA